MNPKRNNRHKRAFAARMAKAFWACGLAFLISACATVNRDAESSFRLRRGDLLFQDLDCGPLCDAIETVTQGVHGAKFSHVGMVSRSDKDGVYVIEAVSAGVIETPLEAFLARSSDLHGGSRVVVGRVAQALRKLVPRAIESARRQLGKTYDSEFTVDNESFYCSELVYEAFREANNGVVVFDLAPMTFNDPATGKPFSAWVEYYAALGVPIPEGEPGLNPGGISRSKNIEIVHAFGIPYGWSE